MESTVPPTSTVAELKMFHVIGMTPARAFPIKPCHDDGRSVTPSEAVVMIRIWVEMVEAVLVTRDVAVPAT